MGTRGLHGYEKPDGKIYYQYLQFDNYPTSRGRDHYEAIIESLTQSPSYFINKNGKPNTKFFNRIHDYLNELQYASGHSICNHGTTTKENWPKLDNWQEWQYWWDRNGNFNFFQTGAHWECTIPWEFSKRLVRSGGLGVFSANPLGNFWERIEGYGSENIEGAVNNVIPHVKLNYGNIMAFPEQNEGGFRSYCMVNVDDVRTWGSMFADRIIPNALNMIKDMGSVEIVVKET